MTVELPAPLRPWAPWLKGLDPQVIDALGPALRQLDLAIGPLVSRAEPGGAEPDGVDGLTRRGSYDRLLLSEWVLADELPDEFLRRAAQREHLFLDLARRTPLAGQRCMVILDGSPDVLGDARLAELALLIVLARRAEAAGAEFRWGVFHRAAGSVFEGLSRRQLTTWQSGRSLAHPTAAHLRAWREHLDALPLPPGDELWLIGGPTLAGLAAPDAWRVRITPDDDLHGDALAVGLHPPHGAPRSLHLVLPDTDTRVRILRRPLTPPEPTPPPRRAEDGGAQARVCPIVSDLRFSDGGHRLMGLLPDGSVGAWKVPVQSRRRLSRPWSSYHLEGDRVVAMGWHRQRLVTLTRQGRTNALQLRKERGEWLRLGEGTDGPDRAEGEPVGRLVLRRQAGGPDELRVLDPDLGIWRVPLDGSPLRLDPSLPEGEALYIGHREGHVLRVWHVYGELFAAVGAEDDSGAQQCSVLVDHPHIAIGPTGPPWHLGLVFARIDDQRWLQLQPFQNPNHPPVEIRVPPDEQVLGATRRSDHSPALLCFEPQTGSLRLRGTGVWTAALPHEGRVTHACTSPGTRYVLAWRTDDGRITMFDLHTNLVLQRLFPTQEEWEAQANLPGGQP